MNNKPVAYIDRQDLERLPHHDCWVNGQEHKNSVPLYTHPVKEQDTDCQYCKQGCIRCDARKQLTDEEIEELQIQHTEKGHFADTLNVKNFARAILRKAQEKC
jgi:hypothetical protein